MAHHTTFRDLASHTNELRDKMRPEVQKMAKYTLEEIHVFMAILHESIYHSFQQVDEKFKVDQTTETLEIQEHE